MGSPRGKTNPGRFARESNSPEVPLNVIYQYRLNPDGTSTFPFGSPSIEGFYGLPRELLAADANAAFAGVVKEDLERVKHSIAESAANMSVWECEFRLNTPAKGLRCLHGRAVPFRQEDGGILWHGFFNDVTEQKVANENSRRREKLFQAYFEAAPIAILAVNDSGSIEDANPAVQRMLDYGLPTLQRLTLFDLHRPGDKNSVRDLLAKLHEGKEEDGEHVWLRHGGQEILVQLRVVRADQNCYLAFAQDITERKFAEKRLQESESRLSVALEAANLGTFDYCLTSGTATTDVRHDQIFGYSSVQSDWSPGKVLEQVLEQDRQTVAAAIARGETTGDISAEFRVVWPDGSIHWVAAHGTAVRDGSGYVVHNVGTLQDITERKLAEEKLRESEARLRALVDAHADVVYRMSPDWSEMRHLEGREFIVDTPTPRRDWMQKYIHPDDQPRFLVAIQEAIRTTSTFELEHRVIRTDGSLGWTFSRAVPMLDAGGEVVEWVGAATDVTAQRAIDEELVRYRQFLEVFVAYAPAAIAMLDRNMRYLRTSLKWSTDLGFAADEPLAGKLHYELLPTVPDSLKEACRRGLGGETLTGEDSWVLPNGRSATCHWEVHPWGEIPAHSETLVADNGGIMLLLIDVTERRKLEVQLARAQKSEALGQLAGGVAHDFNNLLQVIQSYGESLRDLVSEDVRARRWSEDLLQAAKRASSLTRQLLAFSRRQVLKPVTVNLNEIVQDTIRMLKRLLPENIEIRVELATSLWTVEADPDQMANVLINLDLNARDAMPLGGTLTISTHNQVVSQATPRIPEYVNHGEYAVMTIEDTGIGIDANALPHIFEPFYTTKEKDKGTGLGLASVYGIVKQSGGYVWADSEPGEGARFTVCLPRSQEAEFVLMAGSPNVSNVPGRGIVLVVDDDASVRDSVTEFARSLGYTVLAAGPGEALGVAIKHLGAVDLLITDVVMRGRSGLELAQQIETMDDRIKIIYMSGHLDDSLYLADVARIRGAFLQKPFSKSDLETKIREVLGG